MPKFAVTVEGVDYEVDAPDESTAWAWGWQFHQQSMTQQPPVAAPPVAAPPVAAPPVAAPPVAAPPVAAPPVAAPPVAAPPMAAPAPEMDTPPTPSAPPSAPVVPPSAPSIPVATDIATPPAVAPEVSPPGVMSQIGRQLGLTARMGAEGAAGLLGTLTDPVSALINQFVPPENRLKTLQSVMSEILTQAGVPEPANEVERIVHKVGGGMVGAAGGIGAARQAGTMMTGPTGRAVAGQLAAMPGAQIAGGGGAGGATQAAVEAGAGPAAQMGAGLVGGVAGGLAASPRSISVTSQPSLSDVETAAAQSGVPLMRSDVSPPQTGITRGIQRAGEAVPLLGTTRPRLAQQEARVAAVRDVVREYADPGVVNSFQYQSLPEGLIGDLIAKRSKEVNKYRDMKQEVFERLASAGEVPLSSTVSAIDDQIARLRSFQSKGLGDEINAVQERIKALRASRLELPKGYKQEQLAILRQELVSLRELNKKGKIYEPAIKILEDWKAALPGKNIQEIEQLRSSLGEQFSTPELLNMRTVSEKAVSSIYKNLRDDIGTFIQNNGERRDFTKWKVANTRLKDQVDELDMDILKRTLDKGEVTPEIVENMLFSKFPSVIKGLYDNLTPNGRSVARAAIISRAARESEVQEGARTVIDPTKFADNVKNLGESVNVFFTGDDLKRVEGLVKVLNATRRAGEVAARAGEEPSVGRMAGTVGTVTGVAGLPLAGLYQLFGGGILGGAAATVGVGTLGAAARIYESAAMRDLLRKVAAAKPGEEMALITKLSTLKVPTPQPEPQQ
jgi:hypothetical protein